MACDLSASVVEIETRIIKFKNYFSWLVFSFVVLGFFFGFVLGFGVGYFSLDFQFQKYFI